MSDDTNLCNYFAKDTPMTKHFFIGIDGGATKSIIRIEDAAGKLLAREISGPANIRLSVEKSWLSINQAIASMLGELAIQQNASLHCGMGLAGFELPSARQRFLTANHNFATLALTSDAHIAQLGAHDGKAGAIIIAGTGSVGYQIEHDVVTKIGGWGFPHDDEGSGAWIGMQAIKKTVAWYDGREGISLLAEKIFMHFNQDIHALVTWANQANSNLFAELAPIVIETSRSDSVARDILQQAANAISHIAHSLMNKQKQSLPFVLIGSIATHLEPYLAANIRERLISCHQPPDAGAIYWLKTQMQQKV